MQTRTMKLLYLFIAPLLSTIGVVFGQSAEQAIQTMDSYANDGKAFLILRKHNIPLYEEWTFANGTELSRSGELSKSGESSPDLFWLGPPTVVRDKGTAGTNGKIVMAVALALQYNEEEEGIGGGASTAKWQTAGFVATWKGDGYRHFFSDFSNDENQKVFEDLRRYQKADTGSFHMPAATRANGFVSSGLISWQNGADPLVISMKDHLGVLATGTELTVKDFQDQYDSIYEYEKYHATMALDATSGDLSKGSLAFRCKIVLGVVAAFFLC